MMQDDAHYSEHAVTFNPAVFHRIASAPATEIMSSTDVERLSQRQNELKRELLKINLRLRMIQKSNVMIQDSTVRPFDSPEVTKISDQPSLGLPYSSDTSPQHSHLHHLLNMVMGLPKKEIPRFNGDPIDYWRFYHAFTHGIAQYTDDAANRLAYLITYCDGSARKLIEHCTILDPEEGYEEAWKILKRCFGEPHVIAQKFVASLTDGPVIHADDDTELQTLAEFMRACNLTLQQLGVAAELNTQTTMSAVVARLPKHLQFKWFDVASAIMRTSRMPNFEELTRFVRESADVASTKKMYAPRASASNKQTHVTTTDGVLNTRLCTLHVISNNPRGGTSFKPSCSRCRERHYLDDCPNFRALPPSQRRVHVEDTRLCTLCLKPNHIADECRTRKVCGLKQCAFQHHPLLHHAFAGDTSLISNVEPKDVSAMVNAGTARSENPSISLGVVPVKLKGPAGEVIVNALLDTGSDATLLSREVMQKLGLAGTTKVLSLTTVHGEGRSDAFRVALSIGPVDSDDMQIVNAWAVDHLPAVTTLVPRREQLKRWQHLDRLELPSLSAEPIAILIGMDFPYAHWVLRSKTAGIQDPYAIQTPLGWVLLGPLNGNQSSPCLSQEDSTGSSSEPPESAARLPNKPSWRAIRCSGKGPGEADKQLRSSLPVTKKTRSSFESDTVNVSVSFTAATTTESAEKPASYASFSQTMKSRTHLPPRKPFRRRGIPQTSNRPSRIPRGINFTSKSDFNGSKCRCSNPVVNRSVTSANRAIRCAHAITGEGRYVRNLEQPFQLKLRTGTTKQPTCKLKDPPTRGGKMA